MLPPLSELLSTQRWVARRWDRRPNCDPARLGEALAEAAALAAGCEDDEPAALLFVLAQRPNALPDTWNVLPPVVARNHAARIGVPFALPPEGPQREDLLLTIAGKLITFEQLCERLRGA